MREFGEKIAGVEYFPRPGSYALITENGRVGVVRSGVSGKYFLVGGGRGAGETETAALRREAREEIGFEIEILEKIGAAREYFYNVAECRHIVKECHFYRVRLLGKSEDQPETALVWLDRDRLGELHHQSHRWIAEKILEP